MDSASIRTDLRYDDLQPIIDLHGRIFAAECGWNATFKVYVAGPLMSFHRSPPPRSRIWIAEADASWPAASQSSAYRPSKLSFAGSWSIPIIAAGGWGLGC